MGISFASALPGVLCCVLGFSSNDATTKLIVKVFQAVLFHQPYKWIMRCYWLSHKCVVIIMCEPSCEKSKQCALAGYSVYHVLLFFFGPWLSLLSLPASIWIHPLTLTFLLTVLTACPPSSLLFLQSHSTICKSSGPQWNRVTTEEKHQVNMAHVPSLFHWLIWFSHNVVHMLRCLCFLLNVFMFSWYFGVTSELLKVGIG